MTANLSSSAHKVQQRLMTLGFSHQVIELPESSRTSKEAAQSVNCLVGQIAKSLVFKGQQSLKPFLVIASGSNRVDEAKLAKLVNEPVEKPDAEFVRSRTGFVIGGVPPLGHVEQMETFIDKDLFQYQEIWAAAGTPNTVFKLVPHDLVIMTNGRIVEIK